MTGGDSSEWFCLDFWFKEWAGNDVTAESGIAWARTGTEFTAIAAKPQAELKGFPLSGASIDVTENGSSRTDAAAAFPRLSVCYASEVLGIHGVEKSENAFGFAEGNDYPIRPRRRWRFALDVQMHGPRGRASGLEILFYFFFAARDVWMGVRGLRRAREAESGGNKTAVLPD